jgi:hypothetical protein
MMGVLGILEEEMPLWKGIFLVWGSGLKLHNEQLHHLYSLPNIIRVIRSRRMRLAGHVAHMEEIRDAFKILARKPEWKRPLGRPR